MQAARARSRTRMRTTRFCGSAGAVTLERKHVFAGPKHRFDALADGSEMRPVPLLIGSGRPHDGAAQFLHLPGEVLARIPLVADDGLPAFEARGRTEERHLPFRLVGRGELDRPGSAVRGAEQDAGGIPRTSGNGCGSIRSRRSPPEPSAGRSPPNGRIPPGCESRSRRSSSAPGLFEQKTPKSHSMAPERRTRRL